uniref:Uncharacterized protein n=1 Tax=Panagrolaimus sp. JU765 TaxID=591449 RepID=A0AC34QPH4_9BILA
MSSKALIALLALIVAESALASGIGYGHGYFPWGSGYHGEHGWGAAPYYGYANGHGSNFGHGHDDAGSYGKQYGHDFAHGDKAEGGNAAGFAKGAKSDWANYQYGGEGSRAEGDAFAKSYGTSFGDGHDAGHAYGHGANHVDGHGAADAHNAGWGHAAPHFAAHHPW